MTISYMQVTHYSYSHQQHVRSDTLQAEPRTIFTIKGLDLLIFLSFTEKYKANLKIIIKKDTLSRVRKHMQMYSNSTGNSYS